MSLHQISHCYGNTEAGNPLSLDLNIQISQLLKSNKKEKEMVREQEAMGVSRWLR